MLAIVWGSASSVSVSCQPCFRQPNKVPLRTNVRRRRGLQLVTNADVASPRGRNVRLLHSRPLFASFLPPTPCALVQVPAAAMSSSRPPRESVNRLESTTARIPSVSRSNRRPSIRTNVDSHSPIAGGRSPPFNVGGPSVAPLAETLLARRGQLPSQRSYRTADDRSSLAGTADGESRGPIWGVGGVFPRAPVKRRRPKARDFEAERAADAADAERAAAADGGRIPRYTTGTMETADTLGSPVLEQPDPFAALGGSAEARKTNPSLAPASIRSTSANPAPSVRSISRNQAPSLRSRSTTACDETSPKRELDEDEAQSPTNTHDDEQGQVSADVNIRLPCADLLLQRSAASSWKIASNGRRRWKAIKLSPRSATSGRGFDIHYGNLSPSGWVCSS